MRQAQKTKLQGLKRELQAKQQISLPQDPVEFFVKVLGLIPYPYQADFLRDPSPLKVLRWCKRAGKTTVMSGDDIRFAALHPNSRVIVTMPKFKTTMPLQLSISRLTLFV